MQVSCSPLRENRIVAARRAGRRALGVHLVNPMIAVIEMLGPEPFDFVYLDAEHGSFDLRDIEDACRAAEGVDLTVLARVPHVDPVLISRYLDSGVQGIIAPHVSTAEAAQAAVDACFFAPKGKRPFAASRIHHYRTDLDDLDAVMSSANANTTLSVQIEDRDAITNLDAIADVAGIDYFTIGKNDLSLSFGFKRQPRGFPPELTAIVSDAERRLAAKAATTKDEWMVLGRAKDFFIEGARRFCEAQR